MLWVTLSTYQFGAECQHSVDNSHCLLGWLGLITIRERDGDGQVTCSSINVILQGNVAASETQDPVWQTDLPAPYPRGTMGRQDFDRHNEESKKTQASPRASMGVLVARDAQDLESGRAGFQSWFCNKAAAHNCLYLRFQGICCPLMVSVCTRPTCGTLEFLF